MTGEAATTDLREGPGTAPYEAIRVRYPEVTSEAPTKLREILLIEDNLADIRLTQEALAEGPVGARLRVARDGVEALSILRGEGESAAEPLPELILLDLNLPRKDGRELLAEIKEDPKLRRIPVLVLTTSQSAQDVAMCYDLHANCYLTKPVQLDQFVALVRAIGEFWFGVAVLSS